MVEAYNLYIGGYLPEISPKSAIHKKQELKKIYNNILQKGKHSPLSFVKLSTEKQAYALDIKEISLELEATTGDALSSDTQKEAKEKSDTSATLFNKLLAKSDEFAQSQGKTSRPGNELRRLVSEFSEELSLSGYKINEDYTLSFSDDKVTDEDGLSTDNENIPSQFLTALNAKSKAMSIDPMEYIDKVVCSYFHLAKNHFGSAYADSAYSGMLFNSYC